jgi:Sulfotransferase family
VSIQVEQKGCVAGGGRAVSDDACAVVLQWPDCLIHIGYHRTGSSFLQTELFPLIPRVAITPYLEEAERHAADPTLRLAIFTDESLSNDLTCDTPHFAPELARKFPGARILIGIRSQYSVMRGAYHLYMKTGGTDDYEAFVRVRCGRLFDYARMVDAYRQAFGSEHVFVLPQEDLLRDPLISLANLLRFIGCDPELASKVRIRTIKPSVGDTMLTVLRQRNLMISPLRRLWPQAYGNITYWGVPGARLIDRVFANWLRLPIDGVRPMIREAYADGNARLFASLGLNPADYDYPLPGKP